MLQDFTPLSPLSIVLLIPQTHKYDQVSHLKKTLPRTPQSLSTILCLHLFVMILKNKAYLPLFSPLPIYSSIQCHLVSALITPVTLLSLMSPMTWVPDPAGFLSWPYLIFHPTWHDCLPPPSNFLLYHTYFIDFPFTFLTSSIIFQDSTATSHAFNCQCSSRLSAQPSTFQFQNDP